GVFFFSGVCFILFLQRECLYNATCFHLYHIYIYTRLQMLIGRAFCNNDF
ncbi:hypothetical protein ACJX0J_018571, partial [Zea mays]